MRDDGTYHRQSKAEEATARATTLPTAARAGAPNSAGLRASHPGGRGGTKVIVNNSSSAPITTTTRTAPDPTAYPADAGGQN